MELYFAYPSPYSQKVLIALYEKKMDFVGKHVDLMDPADLKEYRAIYPLGKVPLLVTDDAQLVPESSIIIEYLDQLAPEPRLIPEDLEAARTVRLWDRLLDQHLCSPVINLLFESRKPEAQRDARQIERWSHSIGTTYRMMDDQLARLPYLAGMQFSMADCAAMPALHYASQFARLDDFERLKTYLDMLRGRPAVTRVFDDAAPYIAKLMS